MKKEKVRAKEKTKGNDDSKTEISPNKTAGKADPVVSSSGGKGSGGKGSGGKGSGGKGSGGEGSGGKGSGGKDKDKDSTKGSSKGSGGKGKNKDSEKGSKMADQNIPKAAPKKAPSKGLQQEQGQSKGCC